MAVPFDLLGNQVVLAITIGGRGPYVCLLDTAVAPSVVDLALARELGLRVRDDAPGEAAGAGNESASFYPSELPDVRLGELGVGDVEAVAADLSQLGSKLNQPLHAERRGSRTRLLRFRRATVHRLLRPARSDVIALRR